MSQDALILHSHLFSNGLIQLCSLNITNRSLSTTQCPLVGIAGLVQEVIHLPAELFLYQLDLIIQSFYQQHFLKLPCFSELKLLNLVRVSGCFLQKYQLVIEAFWIYLFYLTTFEIRRSALLIIITLLGSEPHVREGWKQA